MLRHSTRMLSVRNDQQPRQFFKVMYAYCVSMCACSYICVTVFVTKRETELSECYPEMFINQW